MVLQHLEINSSECSQLTDVSYIGQGLKAMKNLQREDRLQQCGAELRIRRHRRELRKRKRKRKRKITDVSSIGQGLKAMNEIS